MEELFFKNVSCYDNMVFCKCDNTCNVCFPISAIKLIKTVVDYNDVTTTIIYVDNITISFNDNNDIYEKCVAYFKNK